LRLFIGLPLPDELRLILARHLEPWKARRDELKWVDSGQYHFTLQFLGETAPDRLPGLIESLGKVSCRSDFSLETGQAFAMPPGPKARVLALGLLSGVKALRELAHCVREATAAAGFPPEARDFKAHLTLGRVRRGRKLLLEPEELGRPPLPAFQARAFHLYESELRREGPVHSSLLEVRLGRS